MEKLGAASSPDETDVLAALGQCPGAGAGGGVAPRVARVPGQVRGLWSVMLLLHMPPEVGAVVGQGAPAAGVDHEAARSEPHGAGSCHNQLRW